MLFSNRMHYALGQLIKGGNRRHVSGIKLFGKKYIPDEMYNITPEIISKTEIKLHNKPNNPIHILKKFIEKHFEGFKTFEFNNPVVTVKENFDDLLFPPDHPGRSKNDTYYINSNALLRSHTSAHQLETLKRMAGQNCGCATITADVYRRDEIDSKHYPVFHQTELIKVHWSRTSEIDEIKKDLQSTLDKFVESLFNSSEAIMSRPQMRWTDTYFPFTDPSWELEIKYRGEWLEILGCGIIKKEILDLAGQSTSSGWACGMGLERLCILLFDIPDVRIFWSTDERFTSQFKDGKISKFCPFSRYPPIARDISFWLSENFSQNSLMEIIREGAGEDVEEVKLSKRYVKIDEYTDESSKKVSMCYRIIYRSMERTLTNKEVDELHGRVCDLAQRQLKVVVR